MDTSHTILIQNNSVLNVIGLPRWIKKKFLACRLQNLWHYISSGIPKRYYDWKHVKGRTVNKHLTPEVSAKLQNFFKPFDDYLAQMIGHEQFKWKYGQEWEEA